MYTSKAYERGSCPICHGPLAKKIDGTEPGEHEEWTVCVGACQRRFAPPWLERHWGDPKSRPIPAELATTPSRRGISEGNVENDARLSAYKGQLIYDESGLPIGFAAALIRDRRPRDLYTLDKVAREKLTFNDMLHMAIAASSAVVLTISIAVAVFYSVSTSRISSSIGYVANHIQHTLI